MQRTRTMLWQVAKVVAPTVCMVLMMPGVASAAFPGDNGSITFQSTQAGIGSCNPYTSSELFSVSPFGGSTSQVDCSGFTDQHVFVSPDGSEVVFASNRAGGSDAFQLYTEALPPQGSNGPSPSSAIDVSYPPSAGVDDYPSWVPAVSGDQGIIIFQRTLAGGNPQLYTEDVNTPSSPAVPVFTSVTGFSDTQPVYDPSNANQIAFVRQATGGPKQIFTYNLSTPSVPPVNLSSSDGDGSSNDSKPDFAPTPTGSPAVQKIVFQSDRSSASAQGGPCTGTQLYTVTDQPGSAVTPVFQVLAGSPPAPTGQQACPKVDGTSVAIENPAFSPQGDAIAYDQLGAASQDLYAFSVSLSGDVGVTSTETDLTPNFATDEAPNWAPVFPGVSTPESPSVILLPAAGVGLGGVVLLANRRRRKQYAHTVRSRH